MATIISDNSYDYEEKFLAMAKDFFNLDTLSTAKLGMFGYTTTAMSHLAKDAAFHRNMLYREFFPNTAVMNNSLYNWARILDYNIDFAKPAVMQVAMRINIDDIIVSSIKNNYGVTSNGYKIFSLKKDQVFTIGKLSYLLPHEIEIKCKSGTVSPSVEAKYIVSDLTTNYNDPLSDTTYIKILVEGQFATLFFNIYQMAMKTTFIDVLSTDSFDNTIFDVKFGKNLVSFAVDYKSSGSSVYNSVPMVFGEDWAEGSGSRNGYYTITDETNLRLFFSSKAGSFRPTFNSKLKVTTITTEGSLGNYDYSGRVTLQNSFFSNAGYSIINLTESSGGKDQINFLETKKSLINKLRTRDSYITEFDLNSFFELVRSTRIQKGMLTEVIRTRDDIIKRVFSAYVLLKLKSGEVVPSNTVNLEMTAQDIVDRSFSIKPGSMVIYDKDLSKYRLLGKNEIPDPYFFHPDGYSFVVPFLIHIDFDMYPKTDIYRTDYNINIPVSYKPYTQLNGNVMLNFINLKRSSLVDLDKFVLSLEILGDSTALAEKIVVARLRSKIGDLAGIATMTQIPDTASFFLNIFTSDNFSQDGKYIIENTFFSSNDISILLSSLPLSGEYYIDIGIYDSNMTSVASSNSYIDFISSVSIGIAEDITKYVHIPVTVDQTAGKLSLNRVPLLGANFFYNDVYNRDISGTLSNLFSAVNEIDTALENNTSIDIKFFNSSGPSNTFNSDTTDLRVKLQIKLIGNESNALDLQIKRYIANFVEGVNTNLAPRFSVSNLISSLEKDFSEISYIQVFSINSANLQSVEKLPNIDTRDPFYIPEYLNIKKKTGSSSDGAQDFIYDIIIEYL